MIKGPSRILVVDDDKDACTSLSLIFKRRGYEIEVAGTGQAALEKARAKFFNLALLDIGLPDMEGIELLTPLREMHPDIVLILITGYASIETAVRALNEGASAYISKPLNMSEVLEKVEKAIDRQNLVMENRRLYQEVQRELAERKQAEAQLRHQERIAAVGQLAGGITHDFNNFLTTIILYSQMLLKKPHLPDDIKPALDIILNESREAARLVQQILGFGRRSIIDIHPMDLRAFTHETVNVLRRTLPENIRLVIEEEEESAECVVNADPTRIRQMLMNLVINARDAMPEGGELRIALTRTKRPAAENLAWTESPVKGTIADEWVCLTISDQGIGMSPEVLSHLYEPYFTTKAEGKGTGLGLTQVHGIVEQHEGYIKVESTPGQGTTFWIYLPVWTQKTVKEQSLENSLLPVGKGETILLVEDEEKVRKVGLKILESLGYRALTAANGREALKVYESAAEVNLVITDMLMPEMGGRELARELKKKAPDIKILAITGYVLAEDLGELRGHDFVDVLQKPFEINTLAKIIHRILAQEEMP